jgi:hypothetical protein
MNAEYIVVYRTVIYPERSETSGSAKLLRTIAPSALDRRRCLQFNQDRDSISGYEAIRTHPTLHGNFSLSLNFQRPCVDASGQGSRFSADPKLFYHNHHRRPDTSGSQRIVESKPL